MLGFKSTSSTVETSICSINSSTYRLRPNLAPVRKAKFDYGIDSLILRLVTLCPTLKHARHAFEALSTCSRNSKASSNDRPTWLNEPATLHVRASVSLGIWPSSIWPLRGVMLNGCGSRTSKPCAIMLGGLHVCVSAPETTRSGPSHGISFPSYLNSQSAKSASKTLYGL
jgi:hypothetical protein